MSAHLSHSNLHIASGRAEMVARDRYRTDQLPQKQLHQTINSPRRPKSRKGRNASESESGPRAPLPPKVAKQDPAQKRLSRSSHGHARRDGRRSIPANVPHRKPRRHANRARHADTTRHGRADDATNQHGAGSHVACFVAVRGFWLADEGWWG